MANSLVHSLTLLSVADRLAASFLIGLLFCAGCGPTVLQRRFAAETGCRKETKVRSLGAGAYRVKGCGKSFQYVCVGHPGMERCVRESMEVTVNDHRSARKPAPAPAEAPSASRVTRSLGFDGVARIEALIAGQTRMRVVATPTRAPDEVLLSFVRDSATPFEAECEVRLVADGVPLEPLSVAPRTVAQRQELGMSLPLSALIQIAKSQRVVGRLCGDRFELNAYAINVLREFVLRFQEEIALSDGVPPTDSKPVGESL